MMSDSQTGLGYSILLHKWWHRIAQLLDRLVQGNGLDCPSQKNNGIGFSVLLHAPPIYFTGTGTKGKGLVNGWL